MPTQRYKNPSDRPKIAAAFDVQENVYHSIELSPGLTVHTGLTNLRIVDSNAQEDGVIQGIPFPLRTQAEEKADRRRNPDNYVD